MALPELIYAPIDGGTIHSMKLVVARENS